MRNSERRERAFEQFKKVAQAEQADGVENLALLGLVPQFSNAPKEETEQVMVCMQYWSRKGDREILIQQGRELYQGGYNP
jgi:hypothetical protein